MSTNRDELPIPDYDHLTVDALTHRIRSLDEQEVQELLTHEQQHGNRLPVCQVLEARIEQLRGGAEPSGGDPTAVPNDAAADAPGSPGLVGTNAHPPVNPPSHGDPTNPAQPRT